MNDNNLAGAELKQLAQYDQLQTIKFGNNQIKQISDLEPLVSKSSLP
jgi:hypothetical protein